MLYLMTFLAFPFYPFPSLPDLDATLPTHPIRFMEQNNIVCNVQLSRSRPHYTVTSTASALFHKQHKAKMEKPQSSSSGHP